MRNRVLLVALLHVLAASGLAKDPPLSDWQNLGRIAPGAAVEVWRLTRTTADKASWRSAVDRVPGKFVRFSDNDLTLDVKGKEVTIAKPTVAYVVLEGSDGRSTLVGAVAGAAAGAALGAAARDERHRSATAAGSDAATGAAIGAGIGSGLIVSPVIYKADLGKRKK